ncbi:MAG TPA: extracellular solute-binding protein, partial [Mobilitalea sp.]|nr:extracellular solute-binding protein [Mobilitalea sp.]
LFGADGRDPSVVTFNDAKGLEIGNYLIDLAANPKFLDEAEGNILTAFANGTLGAACSGTWNAETIKEALGDNYAATKLPTINVGGADQQLSNFADFKLIGVNSQTKAPIPAMQLAEWLANEENQKTRFAVRSIAPTNLALAADPEVLANTAVAALSLQTSFSTLQSTIPQMGNYWTPAEAFGTELISGVITKDNLQEKLDAFVESILSSIG